MNRAAARLTNSKATATAARFGEAEPVAAYLEANSRSKETEPAGRRRYERQLQPQSQSRPSRKAGWPLQRQTLFAIGLFRKLYYRANRHTTTDVAYLCSDELLIRVGGAFAQVIPERVAGAADCSENDEVKEQVTALGSYYFVVAAYARRGLRFRGWFRLVFADATCAGCVLR